MMDFELFEGLKGPGRSYSRSERVADLLKEEVAGMLLAEIKDPRVQGMVTIMSVRVTKDLRHATFGVSVMGDEKSQKQAMAGLRKASGFIRFTLGKRLKIKRIPELHFEMDRSLDAQEHIELLLRKIHEEE
jgi:ribosome-binding factor A